MTPLRRLLALAATLAVAAGLTLALPRPDAANAATADTACREVTVPVTIAGGSGAMAGTLCRPARATRIQVLVPGITYDRAYWDPPGADPRYSYVRHANAAGYATLAIDRLATGRSWHPAVALTGYDQQVDALHQVMAAVRAGRLGATWRSVTLVGHSLGTLISYGEAARHPGDADVLVATGGAHGDDFTYVGSQVLPKVRPAPGEPAGYVTIPGDAHNEFVNRPDTDPANLAINATSLVAVDTLADAGTFAPTVLLPPTLNESRAINIPVLTIDGQQDKFFCHGTGLPGSGANCSTDATLTASERPYYGPGATLTSRVIPGTGHALNLERTAPRTFDQITAFLDPLTGS